jgi:tetratricopeptide (TPR) repeat protein
LGVVDAAIEYLEEAHDLAPNDPEIAVELGRAYLFTDPEKSVELTTAVLAGQPDDLDALLLEAEAQGLLGEYSAAFMRLEQAEGVAPRNANVEWSRARVYEAKLRALRLKPGRTVFNPSDFEAAETAYDAYLAKGGDQRTTVLLSKAKLYSSWPGHAPQAIPTFIEAADQAEDPAMTEVALDAMARYARAVGDDEQLLVALDRLTALDPARIDRWDERVRVARALGAPTGPILEAMIEEAGDDPRAHIVYARNLKDEQGLTAAVEHLKARIEETDDDALLLSALVQLQTRGGRPRDGEATLAELRRKHPDDIETRLLLARRALADGRSEDAVAEIEEVARTTGNREALRVWARATEAGGDPQAALVIVERMIDDQPEFDAAAWAWKADLLYQLGQPDAALAALRRLDWGDELTPAQLVLQARCEYELGRRVIGRQRLLDLLEGPEPPIAAVLEFHARERDHPPSRPIARQALAEAYSRAPGRMDLLEALVDLDLLMQQPQMALQRITLTLDQRPRDPRLYAMRAQVWLAMGNAKQAHDDAERSLLLQPGQGDEALAVLIAISELPAARNDAIAALEAQAEKGSLPLHRQVVLGRLLASSGRVDEGLALLEGALAEGAAYTVLKSDLAQLLLLRGGDLDRAETLALEAVEAPGEQVVAADVLGSVYMAKGLYDAAMWQFRFAAENAEPPNALYLHHLGQALEAMGRADGAREAYARALSIDPDHASSRAALEALGGAAPSTDPS